MPDFVADHLSGYKNRRMIFVTKDNIFEGKVNY